MQTYCRPYPLPMQLGAYASTALMVCACRAFIYGLGNFHVKEDEHYQNFVEKSLSRDPRTPMFTLPNHRSLMDDPMMLASILPVSSELSAQLSSAISISISISIVIHCFILTCHFTFVCIVLDERAASLFTVGCLCSRNLLPRGKCGDSIFWCGW